MSFALAHLTRKAEVIQLQVFLRLRKLEYTLSQIDAEMVLPQAKIPNADADGLFWACKQRCAPPYSSDTSINHC